MICGVQGPSNWNGLERTLTGRRGGHSFRIEIRCANFQPRGRRIAWKPLQGGSHIYIDGRRTWFLDGQSEPLPEPVAFLKKRATEVRRFEVIVDGRRWHVPPSLTSDLLNLNLNSSDDRDYGHAWISKDGRRLVLKQSGSDGGGGYMAYFVFRRKGAVERRIYIETNMVERRTG